MGAHPGQVVERVARQPGDHALEQWPPDLLAARACSERPQRPLPRARPGARAVDLHGVVAPVGHGHHRHVGGGWSKPKRMALAGPRP